MRMVSVSEWRLEKLGRTVRQASSVLYSGVDVCGSFGLSTDRPQWMDSRNGGGDVLEQACACVTTTSTTKLPD